VVLSGTFANDAASERAKPLVKALRSALMDRLKAYALTAGPVETMPMNQVCVCVCVCVCA
jgi:hypothetical protein